MSANGEPAPIPQLQSLVELIDSKPEAFTYGDEVVRSTALSSTKYIFDLAISLEANAERHINGLLNSIQIQDGSEIKTRSKTKADAAPPPPRPALPPFSLTPLDSLYLDSMSQEQIWEQLELRTKNICEVLQAIVEVEGEGQPSEDEIGIPDDAEDSEEDEMDLDMDNIDAFADEDSEEEDDDEDDDEEGDSESEEEEEDSNRPAIDEETVEPIRPGEDELYPELDLDRPTGSRSRSRSKKLFHPTLDDDFFSIDEFNRETEAMESLSRSKGGLSADDEDEDEAEDVDLFQPLDENMESFDEEDEDNGIPSNPTYKDFFAPPPRSRPPPQKRGRTNTNEGKPENPSASQDKKIATPSRGVKFNDSVRVKTIEARKRKRKGILSSLRDDEEDEEEIDWDMDKFRDDFDDSRVAWVDEGIDMDGDDVESEGESDSNDDGDEAEEGEEDSDIGTETIQRLKDDLFDEDSADESSEGFSTHQKRIADLAKEIEAFETENVGKKDWTLMGEATSRSRPKNSLLEEDLEFDHTAKAVPVVTEANTKSLEDRIKARILENRFDDVVRKRAVDDKPFLPSRVFELQDTQSSRSLAQIYEDEYSAVRAEQDGTSRPDDRDGKLAKEHDEIDKMWGAISYKLDALSNAHFTPKQPKAAISTVSNVASTTLESALPTVVSTSTLLAPEEVHAPSAADLRSRSELTPKEKRSARTKERKQRKKRQDAMSAAVGKFGSSSKRMPKNVKEAKDVALKSLVKSGRGVTVMGKDRKRVLGSRSGDRKDQKDMGTGSQWKL